MKFKKFTFSATSIGDITNEIKESKIKINSENSYDKHGISVRFIFTEHSDKVTLTFYRTGKGLLQGSKSNLFLKIEKLISKIKEINLIDEKEKDKKQKEIEDEIYLRRDIIMGLDEAGKSDIIGDLILGLVILPKEKIDIFSGLKKDPKDLTLKELNYYCGLIRKNGVIYDYEKVSACEITQCSLSLNRLMDKRYVQLISRHAGKLNSKCAVSLDDYGIKEELIDYLAQRKKTGAEIICEHQLDEKITANKLSSVIARQIRLTEIEDLSKRNILKLDGKNLEFKKGSNNKQTEDWLEAHRKVHPHLEFPDFVRKNWDNVKRIEEKFPKKDRKIIFNCPHCKENVSKILCYLNKKDACINYYCSICNKLIDDKYIKKLKINFLLCDTNSFVSGIISRDLKSENSIFEGICLIKLHKIMDEIDTIGSIQKRGAQNELQRLREYEESKKITMAILEYEITSPYDADKKLYGMIAKNNGWALISGDYNVADNSHCDGAFVFKIINFEPQFPKSN